MALNPYATLFEQMAEALNEKQEQDDKRLKDYKDWQYWHVFVEDCQDPATASKLNSGSIGWLRKRSLNGELVGKKGHASDMIGSMVAFIRKRMTSPVSYRNKNGESLRDELGNLFSGNPVKDYLGLIEARPKLSAPMLSNDLIDTIIANGTAYFESTNPGVFQEDDFTGFKADCTSMVNALKKCDSKLFYTDFENYLCLLVLYSFVGPSYKGNRIARYVSICYDYSGKGTGSDVFNYQGYCSRGLLLRPARIEKRPMGERLKRVETIAKELPVEVHRDKHLVFGRSKQSIELELDKRRNAGELALDADQIEICQHLPSGVEQTSISKLQLDIYFDTMMGVWTVRNLSKTHQLRVWDQDLKKLESVGAYEATTLENGCVLELGNLMFGYVVDLPTSV